MNFTEDVNVKLTKLLNKRTLLQTKIKEYRKKHGEPSPILKERYDKLKVEIANEMKKRNKSKGGAPLVEKLYIMKNVDDVSKQILSTRYDVTNYKQYVDNIPLPSLYHRLGTGLQIIRHFDMNDPFIQHIISHHKTITTKHTIKDTYSDSSLSVSKIKTEYTTDKSKNKSILYNREYKYCQKNKPEDITGTPLGITLQSLDEVIKPLDTNNSKRVFHDHMHTVFGDVFVMMKYEGIVLNCMAYLQILLNKRPNINFEATSVYKDYRILEGLVKKHHGQTLKPRKNIARLIEEVLCDESFVLHASIYEAFDDVLNVVENYNFLQKIKTESAPKKPNTMSLLQGLNSMYSNPLSDAFFAKFEKQNIKELLETNKDSIELSFEGVHRFLVKNMKIEDHPFKDRAYVIDFYERDVMDYLNYLKETDDQYSSSTLKKYKTHKKKQSFKHITPYAKEYIRKVYHNFKLQILNKVVTIKDQFISNSKEVTALQQTQAKAIEIVSSIQSQNPNDFKQTILKEYFESFHKFVFQRNSVEMGMGAYFISLLVLIVSPPYNFLKELGSMSGNNASLSITEDSFLNFDIVRENIKSKTSSGDDIIRQHFHQSPFLLGLLSFVLKDQHGGSCQDNALINMIASDKIGQLNGFSVYGRDDSDISHWNTNQTCHNHGGILRFKIGVNGIRPGELLGKRSCPTRPKTNALPQPNSNRLYESNVNTPIPHDNYEIRALVFLAITLSHVYRHTARYENSENGIAFKEKFATAIIEKVMETTWNVNRNFLNRIPSNTNSIEVKSFKESPNLALLATLLERNVSNTKELYDNNRKCFF